MTREEVIAEFERVWPWLADALEVSGNTHGKEHVLTRILDGRAQLWTDPKGACVTTIERYDSGLLEVNGWLAGGELEAVQRIVARIENWARQSGINRALITGRRGWSKVLPGYREIATVIIKEF